MCENTIDMKITLVTVSALHLAQIYILTLSFFNRAVCRILSVATVPNIRTLAE